jgi:hypothetical protein
MLQYSPKITTDGLVMCLDASQNKSYPTDLPVKGGLLLWLDAADDSTFSYSSGTVVSQWRDKSGLNNHVAQSTVASQPNRNVFKNSRKSLSFDGGDSLYNAGNVFPSSTTDYTKIAVIYQTSTGTTGNVISSRTVTLGHAFFFNSSTNIKLYHNPGGTFLNSTIALNINTLGIITGTFVYSSGTGNLYVNGTSAGSGTTTDKSIVRDIEIGAFSGGNNFTGEICEVLVFSKVLSATELKQVHTYLGQKWGISNTDRSIVDLAGNDDNGLFGDGTVANMPDYDFYNKGALTFNGTSDYVKVGPNSSLQVNNVTIAAFFKTVNNGQGVQFIAGYGNTGVQGYWLGVVGGPIRFFVGNGSTSLQLNSGISPNNDQIYYVVGTYDGTNQRIYVDGVLMASSTSVSGSLSYTGMTDGFLIGQVQGFTGGRYLTGNIYAMQVYNRALSATEISQNYEAQKSKFANTIVQQGLVLNLDAGNPYSYAGAGATWYDVSGNSYNGVLTSGPTYSTTNGGIINFDGVDDYSISTVANIPASSTVGIWIKSSNYDVKIPISINGDSYGSGPNIFFYSGLINWNIGDSADNPFTNSSYPDSNWHYIVVTNDSSTNAKLYVDGVLIGTAAYRSTASTVSNNFWIGRFHGDNNYTINASVGITHLYNRVLSASEVLQNYNATKGRFGL